MKSHEGIVDDFMFFTISYQLTFSFFQSSVLGQPSIWWFDWQCWVFDVRADRWSTIRNSLSASVIQFIMIPTSIQTEWFGLSSKLALFTTKIPSVTGSWKLHSKLLVHRRYWYNSVYGWPMKTNNAKIWYLRFVFSRRTLTLQHRFNGSCSNHCGRYVHNEV